MIKIINIYRYINFRIKPIYFINSRFIKKLLSKDIIFDLILDVGSGVSPYKNLFSKYKNYFSIDIAPSNVTNICADSNNLPIKSNSIDLIIALEMIQHINNPQNTLESYRRVLKKGGYLIITYPFMYCECDYHDFNRWTHDGFLEFLKKNDFIIINQNRRGSLLFVLSNILITFIQGLFPGNRKNWRQSKNFSNYIISFFQFIVIFPFYCFSWLCLFLDKFITIKKYYIGGIVLAKKK